MTWKRPLLAVILFGTAFGYLEAAIVSYLRLLHEPVRQRIYPGRAAADLFPLTTLDQLQTEPEQWQTLRIEVGREVATLVMLATLALAVARNPGEWAALFGIAFGVWDITFYVFLKVLLDWPASLFTWDILFLVPVPWVGPVIAPVLVSLAMIVAGIWHLQRSAQGDPVRLRPAHWAGILLGAVVIVIAFAFDYRNVMAGAMPNPFRWDIFSAGLAAGVGSYIWAAMNRPMRQPVGRGASAT